MNMNYCPNCGFHLANGTVPRLPPMLPGKPLNPRFAEGESGCLFDNEKDNQVVGISCPCPNHSVKC